MSLLKRKEQAVGHMATLSRDYVYTNWLGNDIVIPMGSIILVDRHNGIAQYKGDHFEVSKEDFKIHLLN